MRKHMLYRLCLVLFCLLLCVPARTVSASNLDPGKTCSLTLHYTQDGQGLENLEIAVHRVGSVFVNGSYSLVIPYSTYPVAVHGITSQQEWKDTAAALQSFITADQILPLKTAVTDQNGTVSFTGLQTGLYLISGVTVETEAGVSQFSDSLMFLPNNQDGIYVYDVDAVPKHSEFTPNQQDIKYSVLKLWKDEDAKEKRPESVSVEIFKNGEPWESVVLNADNNWYYTWSAPAGDTWTVAETQVPDNYTVTLSAGDTDFVITNTYEPEPPEGPKTGDTSHLMLYLTLTCLSGICMVLVGTGLLRGKKHGQTR